MVVAIIAPGEISCFITRIEPVASAAAWIMKRSERVMEAIALLRLPLTSSASSACSCAARQRRARAGSMPIASIASAWRKLAPIFETASILA
ncbi:hypothetical protein D9M72_581700 [compost metagenome]